MKILGELHQGGELGVILKKEKHKGQEITCAGIVGVGFIEERLSWLGI